MHLIKYILKFSTIGFVTIFFNFIGNAQNAPIVAQVNQEKISLETLIHAINDLPKEIQSQPFLNYYEDLWERVIDVRLIAQEAKKINLADDASVKTAIEFVTEKILMQAYLAKYVQENITEESLKNSYENYIADVTSREEIKASHILLDTKEDAILIIKQLNNGESFEELAKMKSKGPSGPSGGDLGWFGRGQMVPAFENQAFNLALEEISQNPVQTQFGWHIIKVFEKRIPEAPSYESIKVNLIQDNERRLISKRIQELRKVASIKKMTSAELEPLLDLPARQQWRLKKALLNQKWRMK